jgi:RNA polymerase sigma-70 factor (ECF subfamily)
MSLSQTELFNIWEEYYPKVYGYFLRRVDNHTDVEDLTSITLTAFLEKLRSEEEIKNKNAFLWKIAHNQLCVFIKNKSKSPITVSVDEASFVENFDIRVEETKSEYLQKRFEALHKCIQNILTGENYQIVFEIIIKDKKSPEVASLLNLKPDTVRQKLKRSLNKIRSKCKTVWQTN